MSVILNAAGVSANDPILKGLSGELVIGSSTFDTATFADAWLDTAATIPGTNSIKASVSPAATVVTAGIGTGTYSDTTKAYTISTTTGLTVGDYLYMQQASLPAGFYKILTIVNATSVTLTTNPLDGGGNKTGISYQVAWRYAATYGTAPIVSSVTGQINYLKARLTDGAAQNGDLAESFFVRDAPVGSAYVSIGAVNYTGSIIATLTPAFNLLSAWANKGGVSHVQLANHSVQASNSFRWGDTTTTEKTISAAIASGFNLVAGDGIKYGRLLLKSKTNGLTIGVDIDVTVDTTGPTVLFFVAGA